MAQTPPDNVEKAAILLRRLPQTSIVKVLEAIGVEKSNKIRIAIEAVSRRPNLSQLEESVLQEFREMQHEIRESLRGSPVLERIHTNQPPLPSIVDNSSGGDDDNKAKVALPVESEDPVADLIKIPPEILAVALKQETPRSMALVLRELPTEFIGKVLDKLPTETRQEVFMFLAVKSSVHPSVTKNVMRAVSRVCQSIDPTVTEEVDPRFKTLIGILQKVDREERLRLMEALAEQDEALAAQIDENLYDYTDIMRIQDRSVQKLLTQLDQKTVALALKTAPEDVVEKVMKNLSERVRASLKEEMEFLDTVSPPKVDEARREIANVIKAQDKEGTLLWIETAA